MAKAVDRCVNIMGTRGIPAAHGGFETFAGQLAPYLAARGWRVNVYCQIDPDAQGRTRPDYEDDWNGIHRIHVGTTRAGSLGSFAFDWKCVRDVVKRPGVDLVLGYNTAIFNLLQRALGRRISINMDGIEWKRAKWSRAIKSWFWVNELIGAHSFSIPIADHPSIAEHLQSHGCRRAIVIPYGGVPVESVPVAPVTAMGLDPDTYMIVIARVEPENSVLEIVEAFSSVHRGRKLVVLGRFDPSNAYHCAVRAAASDEVLFPGAIYDPAIVGALRQHARAYLHGHQVGGTNPSLIEALSAGSPILAHDNRFNRWVAGPEQRYFGTPDALRDGITALFADEAPVAAMRAAALKQLHDMFALDDILAAYETMLDAMVRGDMARARQPTRWNAA